MKKTSALVIFSGGQDSTTCLGWALTYFEKVEAITFTYGQRHSVEVEQAKKICQAWKVKQTLVDISFLGELVESALTSDGDVNQPHPSHPDLPASFVPNRNALFITLSHAYAQKARLEALVMGVCEADSSGYPDCRLGFVRKIQEALTLGSETFIHFYTPLIYSTKAEIFAIAEHFKCLDMVIQESHTCYEGNRELRHEWGAGCGECPACKLREKGWKMYKEELEGGIEVQIVKLK